MKAPRDSLRIIPEDRCHQQLPLVLKASLPLLCSLILFPHFY